MVYVNEIYNGNVNLTEENRTAINAYVNTIKENASYLKGNRGMVKNQLGLANDLLENKTNDNLVNYYLIKSNEALEIRSNKIDTTISAIDSIISILESNLSPNSCYYQNNLSGAYENMISNLSNTSTDENTKLAKNIAESIDFLPSINNTQSGNDTELQKDSNEQRSIPGNQNTINNTPITNQNESKNLRLNNPSNTSYDQNYNNQKTQNTQEITANPSVLTDNSNNIHNSMTPSERARMRRRMAQNRRAYDNVARNQSTNQENLTPQTAIPNTPNNLVENIPDNKNKTQATSAQNEHGRATRVPYKVESTSFVE